MTRREAERLNRQREVLISLGFTAEEAESLRRISMTLQRWYEGECGLEHGHIERDEKTGLTYWQRTTWYQGAGVPPRQRIPDRERGAEKRLQVILKARNDRAKAYAYKDGKPQWVDSYLQTDPRGAALYILRPGDVPAGQDASSYYSRGICVY